MQTPNARRPATTNQGKYVELGMLFGLVLVVLALLWHVHTNEGVVPSQSGHQASSDEL